MLALAASMAHAITGTILNEHAQAIDGKPADGLYLIISLFAATYKSNELYIFNAPYFITAIAAT